MNHYAEYIWSCYILAASLLGGQVILAYIAWNNVWKQTLKSNRGKHAQ